MRNKANIIKRRNNDEQSERRKTSRSFLLLINGGKEREATSFFSLFEFSYCNSCCTSLFYTDCCISPCERERAQETFLFLIRKKKRRKDSLNIMSNKSSNPFTAMTAGCIAGAVEATCVWPMEFIKTQLQLQSRSKGAKLPYTGMISGLRYTVETTGFFSLYRGLAPTLVGSVPKAGIRFGLNSVIKDLLRDKDGKLTVPKNFLAGLGAGVAEALIVVAPVETVKTKVIELNLPFIAGFKHILKTEGFGGIYQGAAATAMKQGSNQGLRFMWFNEYKRIITNDGEKKMTPLLGLFGGMTAGCFSTLGNNPFDVVKTRMQGTKASQYSSTLDCFKQILSKEGISALYAGVVPRLGRVVPGQGIIFMSFETIQDTLAGKFDVFK